MYTGFEDSPVASSAAAYSASPLSVSREDRSGAVGDLYPWRLLAEPHRVSVLAYAAGDVAEWRVDGCEPSGGASREGGVATARHVFQRTGPARVQIFATDGAAAKTHTVMVKFVRREIRSLTDTDRAGFLGALSAVYSTAQAEGERRYGSKYRSAEYLVRKHLYGAADRACDHWHDDAGILNHHVAFTLELEQSLQSIDAAVSVPYWEYTIDAAAVDKAAFPTGQSEWWTVSPVFDEEWFGAVANLSSNFVEAGRWAYTRTPRSAANAAGSFDARSTNAYGLLRSPWNSVSTPFVTRSATLFGELSYSNFPGCDTWHRAFTSPTLAEVLQIMNGAAHGPVHIMVGGQWPTANTSWVSDFWAETITFPSDVLLFTKWLWRKGYVRCPAPGACAAVVVGDLVADESAACRCACSVDVTADDFDAYEFLSEETQLTHWLAQTLKPQFYLDETEDRWHIKGLDAVKEADVWRALASALCDPQNVGDMFTSAAPADPLFWPIHTTAERLVHYRRLLATRGEMDFVQDWRYEHSMTPGSSDFITPPSDTGLVCDWSQVTTEDGQQMPVCVQGTCPGHAADDEIPFANFTGADTELYTNLEFYAFSSPDNADLPYVYDNFAYPHCRALGYDFLPKANYSATLAPNDDRVAPARTDKP